jgi:hypothetical protein
LGHHEEIEQNAATLSSDLTLPEDDRQLLADYSAKGYLRHDAAAKAWLTGDAARRLLESQDRGQVT